MAGKCEQGSCILPPTSTCYCSPGLKHLRNGFRRAYKWWGSYRRRLTTFKNVIINQMHFNTFGRGLYWSFNSLPFRRVAVLITVHRLFRFPQKTLLAHFYKLRTELTSQIAKSIGPRLSEKTFFAHLRGGGGRGIIGCMFLLTGRYTYKWMAYM